MRREGTWIQRHEEKISPSPGGEGGSKRGEEGFGSCFYMFLALGLSYVNWASQECCWFYLRF